MMNRMNPVSNSRGITVRARVTFRGGTIEGFVHCDNNGPYVNVIAVERIKPRFSWKPPTDKIDMNEIMYRTVVHKVYLSPDDPRIIDKPNQYEPKVRF